MMNMSIAVVRSVSVRQSKNADQPKRGEAAAMTSAANEATPAASVGLNQPV